jgi:hypothetical protein
MTVQYLEERVTNLENLVNALVKSRALDKQYTDADINGTRQSVANITPTMLTKTAYIDDTKVVFENAPQGDFTTYSPIPCLTKREGDSIVVYFNNPIEELTDITISIL